MIMSTTTAPVPHGRVLKIWTPEDKSFWEREGEAIAKINLWISVPALFLAFAVWQVWSVVAVGLPALGFKYSTNQLFWLAAAPALSRSPAVRRGSEPPPRGTRRDAGKEFCQFPAKLSGL